MIEFKPEDILKVGDCITGKYKHVYGQRFSQIETHPAHINMLYAMQRYSSVNDDEFIKRFMLSHLLAGPEKEPEFEHSIMCGAAGAYCVVRGDSPAGRPESGFIFKYADRLLRDHPRDKNGLFCRAPGGKISAEYFMEVCPFLAMAGAAVQNDTFLDEACWQYLGMENALLSRSTGLFHHARNWHKAGSLTPGHWARANGYAVYALAEILQYLPETHPKRTELEERCRVLMLRMLSIQGKRGLWHQELLDESSYEETSASAFIVYGLAAALNKNLLGEDRLPALELGWQGLLQSIDIDGSGNITGVCIDTDPGETREYYTQRPTALNDPNGFAPLLLASRVMYELAREKSWNLPLKAPCNFERPELCGVEEYFERLHETSETYYNGDGSWGTGTVNWGDDFFRSMKNRESRSSHPLIRTAGYCVLGYLGAYRKTGKSIYSRRAGEGLDWIASQQEPDGCFRMHTRKAEGEVNQRGCLFPTGIAAAALLKGYEHFNRRRYLDASRRAALWEAGCPVTRNVNFNAFAIWHLAEHYRQTGDAYALKEAVRKTREGMLQWQSPDGGWAGHNSWVWYHGINLNAYAALHKALPHGSPFKARLEKALRGAAGYLVNLQEKNGALRANRDSGARRTSASPHAIHGAVSAYLTCPVPALLNLIYGIVRWRINPESGDPDIVFNYEQKTTRTEIATEFIFALGEYLGGISAPPERTF